MAAQQPEATRSGDAQREPAFQTVRRGYDPEEVRAHVAKLTDRLEALSSQVTRTQRLLDEARRERDLARDAPRADSYKEVSTHVVDLIRRFDQDVAGLRRQAEAEAIGILADARSEAAQLRMQANAEEQEARTRVDEMLGSARLETERLKHELEPVRAATLSRIREMRDGLAASVQELDRVLGAEREQVVVVGEPDDGDPTGGAMPGPPPEARSELGT
ncbi:MAG TPA: hypothetical protein VE646_03040 [Actinomycetota bacterium]|nr:hypothetical protein [Actinomycetota bacterium]